MYGPGLCPVIKFMDLFFMPFVQSMFVQCIDPLGYDSDLQRICIIKLVEKTSWHSFKCDVSNINVNVNGFTWVVIYVITVYILKRDWLSYLQIYNYLYCETLLIIYCFKQTKPLFYVIWGVWYSRWKFFNMSVNQ